MRRKSTVDILVKYIGKLDHKIELLEKRVEKLESVNNLITYIPKDTPYSNSTKIVDGIPNCCKNCSNHPSNGGSGICHCTLPYFENPIKWGITCDISDTPDITYNAMDNTYTINGNVAEYGQLCYAEDTNADTIAKTSTTYHASAKTQL